MNFFKSAIIVLVAVPVVLSTHVHANSPGDGGEQLVRALATEAVSTLSGKALSEKERQHNFRKILHRYFDVDRIGRLALGRYWRKATKGEKSEYLILFEDLLVVTYASRFKTYSTEKLEVNGSSARGGGVLVNSQFKKEGQKPIRVVWRVRFPNGTSKIFDIVVEGVSLIQTQRSQFSSVIRRNGGKISALLEVLKEKINQKQL